MRIFIHQKKTGKMFSNILPVFFPQTGKMLENLTGHVGYVGGTYQCFGFWADRVDATGYRPTPCPRKRSHFNNSST